MKNKKHLREHSKLVRYNDFYAAAFEVINQEYGVRPGTLIYLMLGRAIGRTDPRIDKLAKRLAYLVDRFEKEDLQLTSTTVESLLKALHQI